MSSPKIIFLFAILLCLNTINVQSAFSDNYTNNANPQGTTPDNSLPQNTLTVSTDKSHYTDGDMIVVSGLVGYQIQGYPVIIRIQTPNGNLLSTQQVTVSLDGTYSKFIHAGGTSWLQEGTYTIFAQYGVKNISAQTTFEFKKSIPQESQQSQTNEQPSTLQQPQTTGQPSTLQQPQTTPTQIPQQSDSALQLIFDLSGNNLIVIGVIIAVIVGITIYFVSKSKKSDPTSTIFPPQFGRGDASRIIELEGKTAYIDITVEHPDRKSSSSWNYGTDRKIGSGSGGGYMLTISLKKKDKSLMTEIVNVIEKYDFNSLLINFQNHKSFKSSEDVGSGKAMVLLDEICYDLETRFGVRNKSAESDSSRDFRVDDHMDRGPIHEPNRESEPPKVEPKHARESVLTGKAPIGDAYDDITRNAEYSTKNYETIQKQAEQKRQYEKEMEELRRKQEEEKQRRERGNQTKQRQNIQTQFDPYQVLGLSKTCSCAEIKTKYKKLIMENNPNRNRINMTPEEITASEKKFIEITKAKEMINKEKGCPN